MIELPNHLFILLKEARKRDWEHDSPSKSPPDKVGSTPENKTQRRKKLGVLKFCMVLVRTNTAVISERIRDSKVKYEWL